MADVESKSIPHELPSSHWLKATGQYVLERYLSATMSQLSFIMRRNVIALTSVDRILWIRSGIEIMWLIEHVANGGQLLT